VTAGFTGPSRLAYHVVAHRPVAAS